jgi:hypothetical protein
LIHLSNENAWLQWPVPAAAGRGSRVEQMLVAFGAKTEEQGPNKGTCAYRKQDRRQRLGPHLVADGLKVAIGPVFELVCRTASYQLGACLGAFEGVCHGFTCGFTPCERQSAKVLLEAHKIGLKRA